MGKDEVALRELELPEVGDDDVLVKNLYSSICGTDTALFAHGSNTGHRITVGGEFGHETASRTVSIGKNITEFSVGEGVYPYPLYAKNNTKRAGTIGIAAAAAFRYFGMDKVMPCDRSAFRLKLAEDLGFAVCNPTVENFLRLGKIGSRLIFVAVNNAPRTIDLLHMTYAQQSIIGSGGYMSEEVWDVQKIMTCGRWDLERIITHEFPLDDLMTTFPARPPMSTVPGMWSSGSAENHEKTDLFRIKSDMGRISPCRFSILGSQGIRPLRRSRRRFHFRTSRIDRSKPR